AAAGLAPAILRAAADASWILMEYVDAPAWSEERICSPAGAEQLGRRLAVLHAITAPADVPVADPPAMARGYVARLQRRDPAAAVAPQPPGQRPAEVGGELAALEARPVLVHGDLMAGNLLGPGPQFVDWEYAQATDPSWDWACLLSYYPALDPWMDRLLAAACADPESRRQRLQLQR